jgi:hypothetical protein
MAVRGWCMIADRSQPGTSEVKGQTQHRIREAAGLARPGWIWAAALLMNTPAVAAAALLGWFAFTADGAGLATVAGILFVLALYWALLVTLDSWRVLRRFSRRALLDR